eukprot:2963969-Amphidinium_carterae.1
MAAIMQNLKALEWASDELLQDSAFAPDAKQRVRMLKITMLSGRSTYLVLRFYDSPEQILQRCCKRLGYAYRGSERLFYGDQAVPLRAS